MEFKVIKRKKERGLSNQEFLDWIQEDTKNFKQMAVTVEHENGEIETYFSQENTSSMIGLLEIGKNQIINNLTN